MTEFVAAFFADPTAATNAARGAEGRVIQLPGGAVLSEEHVVGSVWIRGTREATVHRRADGSTLVCSNAHSADRLAAIAAQPLSETPGSFAALEIDASGNWRAATDRFASRPLYRAQAGDGSVWLATDMRLLHHESGIDRELDDQAIFNLVHFHVIPGPRTVYRAITKVPAAHILSGHGATADEGVRYWPDDVSDIRRDRDTLLRDIVDGLHGAVASLVDGTTPNACFLSGGLDSSTIAGSLARHGPTHAFTIGFDEAGYDEMAYAKLAAEHFGLEHHTVYVQPADVRRILPDIATRFGEPFGNLSSIPAFACARMAREAGFESMFAGDGGDEFFAGNERYARHRLISHWRRLPAPLRRPLEPLLIRLVGSRVPLAHKIGRYVDIAKDDLPVRLREDFEHFQGFAPEQIFGERFLQHIDPDNPMHLLRAIAEEAEGRDLLETLLQVDWRLTLTDNDLRKVHYACKAAAVTPVFPMLDPKFVTLARTIPSPEKLTATRLRAIFKDAFTGFLPERIINKPKHGFGLPFGEWLRSDPGLRTMCDERLACLVDRGLLQQTFVSRLLAAHRDEHAAYYGTMIGTLLMLELWLASSESTADWR